MATLSGGVRNRPAVACRAAVFLAMAAAMVGGCAAGPRAYRYRDLPAKYTASAVDTVDTIDLSRLATFSVNSNLIDSGDLLEVTIVTPVDAEAPEPAKFRVDKNGSVSVPPVGKVAVAGMPPEEAEAAIAAAGVQRQMYVTRPHVTVKMEEKKVNRIQVLGEVEEGGEVELRPGSSTLLSAIVAAGGLTDEASLIVEIRRTAKRQALPGAFPSGPALGEGGGVEQASYAAAAAAEATTEEVDLLQAVSLGQSGYYLDDGDVVHVGKRPPRQIHVVGLVKLPGVIELLPNQEMRVLAAIGESGWTKLPLVDKVSVLRQVPDREEPIRIPVSIREAKANGAANIKLQPNDIVFVEETATTVAFETLKTFFRVSMGSSLGNMDLFQ